MCEHICVCKVVYKIVWCIWVSVCTHTDSSQMRVWGVQGMQEQAVYIYTQTLVSVVAIHMRATGTGLLCCQGLAAMCCAPAATGPTWLESRGLCPPCPLPPMADGQGHHCQGENNALPRLAQ